MATTRRRPQPPMFSGYKQKVDTTTYPFPVQPPSHISRIMEPFSHYKCEIYCYKHVPINLHQKTYTNNLNHASTMNQLVPQPVINLYHTQVHQPCTELYHCQPQLVSTCTMNKCINHAPTCTSTCTMNKCINHAPNLYE
jgi:hypothetical protein